MIQQILKLDYQQIIKRYLTGGQLVPDRYDNVDLTYYSTASTSGAPQEFDIVCKADLNGSLNSTFFIFSTPENNYAVYFNIPTNQGQAPNIDGYTNVVVTIDENDTDDEVATALDAALDALSDVTTSVTDETVSVANDDDGAVRPPVDSNTDFTFNVTQEGVTSSNGNGEIATASYSLNNVLVAKLNFVYDSDENLTQVQRLV